MSEKLFYNLGKLNNENVIWNKVDSNGKSLGTKYDKGFVPKCSLNDNGDILEVHSSGKNVFYNVGKIKGKEVSWTKEGTKYDYGRSPSISLNNNNKVVEIHQRTSSLYFWPPKKIGYEQPKSFNQYFRFGDFNGKSINWKDKGNGTKFTNASGANVCINNSENFDIGVVEGLYYYNNDNEYTSIGGVNAIFSNSKNGVPLLDKKKEIKSGLVSDNDTSRKPSIAINDNNDFVIVYQEGSKLYSRVGNINKDDMNIKWNGNPKQYDEGVLASVALNNNGDIVEIHKGKNSKKLYYLTGKLKDDNVQWNQKKGVFFDTGNAPSVALNNKNEIIIVHTS